MPPRSYELTWEDVEKVVAKIAELAPPVSRDKLAAAFGVSSSTMRNIAKRGGWAEKLSEATARQTRSVDEALKAVASLV